MKRKTLLKKGFLFVPKSIRKKNAYPIFDSRCQMIAVKVLRAGMAARQCWAKGFVCIFALIASLPCPLAVLLTAFITSSNQSIMMVDWLKGHLDETNR